VRRIKFITFALVAVACRPPLNTPARGTGNLSALAAQGLEEVHGASKLRAIAFAEGSVWAVDPATGEELWEAPIRPFGRPAATRRTLVIPLRGREVVAVDVDTGERLWTRALPGEALTGLAVDDIGVIATALDERPRYRSVVSALSVIDGQPLWVRPSTALLGVPAAAGGNAFIPTGGGILALSSRTGRILGELPQDQTWVQRVERVGDTLLGISREGFIDLLGGGSTFYRIQTGDVPAFDDVQGFDPGLQQADGIAFRLLAGVTPGAPRDAIFMGRRVLMGLRLDPTGRPIEARWVHLQIEPGEFVAMHVESSRILVVREDGGILHFEPSTGRRTAGLTGHRIVFGAVFVGGEPPARLPPSSTARADRAIGKLLGVLDDPDPRMLPAQFLALDLLWRNDDPRVRDHVRDFAVRDGALPTLRDYAKAHVEGSIWGRADEDSLADLLEILAPGGSNDAVDSAIVDVVTAGGPAALHRLVELLNDPGSPASTIEAAAWALRELDHSEAVEGVTNFVLRYHADEGVAAESDAVYLGLQLLLAQATEPRPARHDARAADLALATIRRILESEFAAPSVRAFLQAHTIDRSVLVGRDDSAFASPDPRSTDASTASGAMEEDASIGSTDDDGIEPL